MVPEICNKHFPHLIFATKNPKNQNLKKMKEMPGDIIILHKNRKLKKLKKPLGDIIILHMCTKNYDQIIYDS